VFENIEEDDYIESLWCMLCCDKNCAKCVCGREKAANEDEIELKTPRAKGDGYTIFGEREPTRCEKFIDRVLLLNPFYSIHYLLHLIFNLPVFFVSFTLVQLSAVTFRVARYLWLLMYDSLSRCKCCGLDWSSVLSTLIIGSLSPLYVAISGMLGSMVYYADIIIHSLFFRPLISAGIFYNVLLRNSIQTEPIVLNSDFRGWVESVYREWAEAADILVNDPEDLDANSTFRNPIMSPKLLLTAFSVLPSIVTQKFGAEIIAPFLIQLIILWIVYTSLYEDEVDDDPSDSGLVRQLAAAGAFLYYLTKARASAGQFALLAKGHTANFFLFIDFVGNILFPYVIIPMAVQVVLTSDGIEIVLNLIALDFVTEIDEELFDESVKIRCQAPYCFRFKIRELPRRKFGILQLKERETVLLVDVYNKVKIKERLESDKKPVETEYWARDSDLSLFQAKLKPGPRLDAIKDAMTKSRWNRRASNESKTKSYGDMYSDGGEEKYAATDDKQKSRENEQKTNLSQEKRKNQAKLDTNQIHLRVYDIPDGVFEEDIKQAVENTESFKPLGRCVGISYLKKPLHWRDAGTRCRFKEIRGEASLWFENPGAIASCYAEFDVMDQAIVARRKGKSDANLKVSLLLPTKDDDEDDGKMSEIRKLFQDTILKNYLPSAREHAEEAHLRFLGKYENDGEDSRVLIVYDFPFALEGDYSNRSKGWLRNSAESLKLNKINKKNKSTTSSSALVTPNVIKDTPSSV